MSNLVVLYCALFMLSAVNALRLGSKGEADALWFENESVSHQETIEKLLLQQDGHELSDIHREHLSAWNEFKLTFKRTYESFEEELHRFKIFVQNSLFVTSHNDLYRAGKVSYDVSINEFADLTSNEFAASRNGFRAKLKRRIVKSHQSPVHKVNLVADLPTNVDWREKGYVTPIKSQGHCGSCWSFSATGALEGQWFAKTGKLLSLSEQQLVDCSKNWGDNGCNGGLMDNAFTYVKAVGGLELESVYPYTAVEGNCKFNKSAVVVQDTGFVDVAQGDEGALQQALATVGPISVAIDASQTSFQLYKSGIYSDPDCSSTELDHGILAVGYGVDDSDSDNEYWIIKNSWGTTWGEQGFGRIARNKANMCGIASSASYPTV